MYACNHACMHAYMYVYVCTYVRMYPCIYVCLYVCICVHIHIRICVCICICICNCRCIFTSVSLHRYAHVCVRVCPAHNLYEYSYRNKTSSLKLRSESALLKGSLRSLCPLPVKLFCSCGSCCISVWKNTLLQEHDAKENSARALLHMPCQLATSLAMDVTLSTWTSSSVA